MKDDDDTDDRVAESMSILTAVMSGMSVVAIRVGERTSLLIGAYDALGPDSRKRRPNE